MRVYKLTNADGTTRGGTLWGEGVEHSVEWSGELCTNGCLHAYASPELAVLMDPIHGDFGSQALLWEAEADESRMVSDGMKIGTARLKTIRQVELPVVTTEQRVRFGILCALKGYSEPGFVKWAEAWLSGEDRSEATAAVARAAARSARAARVAVAAEADWVARAGAEAERVGIDLTAIAREALCRQ